MIYINLALLLVIIMLFMLHKKAKKKHLYVVSICLSVFAFGLYFFMGSPELGDKTAHETRSLDDLQKSIRQLEEALKLDPKDHEKWRAIGDAYKASGQVTLALTSYDNCSGFYEKDPQFLIHYAECLIDIEKGEISSEAFSKIEAALRLNPGYPLGLYYQAIYLNQKGFEEESQKIQEKLKTILDKKKPRPE